MKKLISLVLTMALAAALFAGCAAPAPQENDIQTESGDSQLVVEETTDSSEKSSFTLATLKGPTTMGLVKLLEDSAEGSLDYTVENTIYGAADEITALLVGGKVDMAAIPCNLASILYNKTQGKIVTAAVNTLGVLSVIELGDSINSIADLAGKTLYSTGKGTTPEFALNTILAANGLTAGVDLTVEFKSEATEIAALLSGESAVPGTIAVLPQPYATTVLMNNPEARIALDLTQEWENADLEGSLLTGVLVINRDFAENNPRLIEKFLEDYESSVDWVNQNTAEASELIAGLGIVAKAPIAEKALPHCNIVFRSGEDMKADVSAYLNTLFEQDASAVGGALPGDDFYYGIS